MTKARFINVDPTPENFRALWDKIASLDDSLTTAQTILTTQASTLTSLGTQVASAQKTANTALVKANTAQTTANTAAAPPTGNPPPGTPPPGQPPQPPNGPPQIHTGYLQTTDMLNLASVTIESSPPVNSWSITTTITSFSLGPPGTGATFGKQSGAGRWPDYVPPGWTGPIQYTLWLFLKIAGQWYGAGAVVFWFGEPNIPNIAPSGIGTNPTWWLYSTSVWGPMAGVQPQVGDQVGFMVSAGMARADTAQTTVAERSQVIVVGFPDNNGATWTT